MSSVVVTTLILYLPVLLLGVLLLKRQTRVRVKTWANLVSWLLVTAVALGLGVISMTAIGSVMKR